MGGGARGGGATGIDAAGTLLSLALSSPGGEGMRFGEERELTARYGAASAGWSSRPASQWAVRESTRSGSLKVRASRLR